MAPVVPARRVAWGDNQGTRSRRARKAGTRTQYVRYVQSVQYVPYVAPLGQAALRRRYVPNAGGGYA